MLFHGSIHGTPDTLLHMFIGGAGLGMGSLIKLAFDKLAEKFWDKEWKEFRVWKATQEK